MKIKIEDLKKAIVWMESNSKDVMCSLIEIDRGLKITCKDKYAVMVEIKLAEEGTMTPKIIKEESLP